MSLTKVTYSMIAGAVVNVLDFGAVGDGSTDDTLKLQAAIDSLETSGGVIYFPTGEYKITKPLVLPELGNVQLVGEGRTVSKIVKSGTTAASGLPNKLIPNGGGASDSFNVDAVIICDHPDNSYSYGITIKDLYLRADSASAGYCIYAPRLAQSFFDMCVFVYGNAVFYSRDWWNSRMSRCDIQSGTYGIRIEPNTTTAGTSLTFESCFVQQCKYGYYFSGLAYSSLVSCACDNTKPGGTAYTFIYNTSGGGEVPCTISMINCGTENTAGRHTYIYASSVEIVGGVFGEGDCIDNPVGPTYYTEGHYIGFNSRVTINNTDYYPKNYADGNTGLYDNANLIFIEGKAVGGTYGVISITAPSTSTVMRIKDGYFDGAAGSSTKYKLRSFDLTALNDVNFTYVDPTTVPVRSIYVSNADEKLYYKDNLGVSHALY